MERRFKAGLIRVITLKDEKLLNIHGRLIESYIPELSVESRCIEEQPEGIHDDYTEALAIPKIVSLAREFRDVDVIIISCAGDPAVEEIRNESKIPVVGAGEAAAILTARYGKKVGVIGITEEVPAAFVKVFGNNIVGTCRPHGINSTLDLITDKGRKSVIEKALEVKKMGAQAIALGCTGMATIGIYKELEKVCGIPVIDPVMAEGILAYFECLRRH